MVFFKRIVKRIKGFFIKLEEGVGNEAEMKDPRRRSKKNLKELRRRMKEKERRRKDGSKKTLGSGW
jgi:hypothetical protein